MFEDGHKCPESKMCRHKQLLVQGQRTQVHDPFKPYTGCTRIGCVIFGGAKPKSSWVEAALLCELVYSATRITLSPESAPLWQSLCGDLKPSSLMGLPMNFKGQPGECFGGKATWEVSEVLGSLGGNLEKCNDYICELAFQKVRMCTGGEKP